MKASALMNHYKPVYEAIRTKLAAESDLRAGRSLEAWMLAERLAVMREVNLQRRLLAYEPVGIAVVERAERLAVGHSCDYISKYAHAAADLVFRKEPTESRASGRKAESRHVSTPSAQPSDPPEGGLREDYGAGQIEALVRAVVPRGQTAATYHVLACAARGAVDITAVRGDGLLHPNDVLATLCKAIDAATNTESIYQRMADLGLTPEQASAGVRAAIEKRSPATAPACSVRI